RLESSPSRRSRLTSSPCRSKPSPATSSCTPRRSACSPRRQSSKRSPPRSKRSISRSSASTGDRLLEADAVQALCAELLPLARVVTPNIPEAEVLSGVRIRSLDDAHEAAKRIRDLGPRAVVITGGHSGIAHSGSRITDLLLDGDDWHEYTVARVDSPPLHGTGCTYASAIAAGLALRRGLPEAAEDAQQYVAGAIRSAVAVGRGRVPVNHFWRLRT